MYFNVLTGTAANAPTRPRSGLLRTAVRTALVGLPLSMVVAPVFAADQVTTLPKVKAVADAEAATDGYAPKRTSSATKTDTALRDVPQSITVISDRQIKDQSMQSLADVVRYVPGVGMAQGEGHRDTPIMRGNASTSDMFVDGMRDDVEYLRDLYNVERVEALKGSNAMIFGRGGTGGVINRVTKQAGWNTDREVSLELGSWDHRRATADVGGAVNETLALRVTGVYEDSESFRDGVELERYGVNPSLALALGERTLVRLSYEHFDYDRTTDRGIPSFQFRPVRVDESTFFGNQDLSFNEATVDSLTAAIEHEFANGVTLRNRTMYAEYDKYYQNVFASGAVSNTGVVPLQAYNNAMDRENLFNQTDVLFSLDTGSVKHRFLAGAELGEQVTDNVRNTGFFNNTATTFNASLADTIARAPVTFRPNGTDANNHGRATIAAVYVQDQIEFAPQFQAVVGVRYDNFDVDFRDNRTGSNFSSSDDLVSPRVGLIYKPLEPMSLYASYSVSYLPRAGAQLSSLSLANEALDPEEYKNYEIGAKWDARENLAVTAAVFRLDRENVAVTGPTPGSLILVDGQRTEGLELGLSGQLTTAWSITGGYAYQDAKITRAQSPTTPAGTELAQVPEHVFSLWNKYELTALWGVGLGIIHQTDMFTSTNVATRTTLPDFTRVDGAVFFNLNERWRAQVNVENIFDETYYANAHNDNNITPGTPRSLRASVTAKF